ncbi:MAG: hypothetical protein R6X13_10535 [bacterium]
MRITALALAPDAQRLKPGYPPRGSYLTLAPNIELCRLAAVAAPGDSLTCVDERVADSRDLPDADVTLVHVGFGCHGAACRFAAAGRGPGTVVFCGPQATAWGDSPPEAVRHCVCGEVALAWPELRARLADESLPRVLRAAPTPAYVQPDMTGSRLSGFDTRYQAMRFARGCHCPPESASFCPERLYFRDAVRLRSADEIIGEIISLPGKLVHLLDDDVAAVPEYYTDLFRLLWHYRRHWTVRASTRLLRHPDLVDALSRSGTRVVWFDETFLRPVVENRADAERTVRALYRSVKTLHSARMLAGATVTLGPDAAHADYRPMLTAIRRTDLDFLAVRRINFGPGGAIDIEAASYAPTITPTDPAWVEGGFCSIGSILDRAVRRPRRVGFYNTLVYFLPISLAARQDFLEGTAR